MAYLFFTSHGLCFDESFSREIHGVIFYLSRWRDIGSVQRTTLPLTYKVTNLPYQCKFYNAQTNNNKYLSIPFLQKYNSKIDGVVNVVIFWRLISTLFSALLKLVAVISPPGWLMSKPDIEFNTFCSCHELYENNLIYRHTIRMQLARFFFFLFTKFCIRVINTRVYLCSSYTSSVIWMENIICLIVWENFLLKFGMYILPLRVVGEEGGVFRF